MTEQSMESAGRGTSDPAPRVPGAIDDGGGAFDPRNADILELALLVMMEAAESAQSDLQAILAATKAALIAKHKLRNSLSQVTQVTRECGRLQSPHPYAALVEGVQQAIKDQLDAMSEMGETESLRLQMAMDRLSKMLSTLSNIEKKFSDTEQSITQNLK